MNPRAFWHVVAAVVVAEALIGLVRLFGKALAALWFGVPYTLG